MKSQTEHNSPLRFWSHQKYLDEYLSVFLLITTIALYILLVIQDNIPVVGLIALVILWLIHWIVNGKFNHTPPIMLPILGLLALIPISIKSSVNLGLTLPKVFGLVLSVVLFYIIINYFHSISRLGLAIIALVLLTIAVPIMGFLAADWSGSSFTLPSRVLNELVQYIPFIDKFSSGGGIHVNTVGGTLTFFVPLLVSILWDDQSINRTYFYPRDNAKTINIICKLLVLSTLTFVLTILILTQSRGSYLGVTVGLLVLLIWKRPKVYWLIPMLVVITLAIFLVFADGNIYKFISLLDTSQESDTLQTRLDYWQRTIFLIQDFPITGVGLGTYGKVFDEIYSFTPFPQEGQPAFYAHNMYLAVAASMGIPALILFFALFSITATMVISMYRKVRSVARILLIGLSCGILANLIYGLWDNYLLGEKLAVVLWIYLGIITAIYIHQNKLAHHRSQGLTPAEDEPQRQQFNLNSKNWVVDFFFGAGNWMLFSLVAIAFININPYVSLAIASVGGILLGFLCTKQFGKISVHELAGTREKIN